MLQTIKSFFCELTNADESTLDTTDSKQLAAAALMIEVATIDTHFDPLEIKALIKELQRQFQIADEVLHQLIDIAKQEAEDSTSLFQFTRCVNDEFSIEEKFDLLVGMWRIAFADGNLDKYEEYMVRRIADLIYVPHSDFIRAKHTARANAQ